MTSRLIQQVKSTVTSQEISEPVQSATLCSEYENSSPSMSLIQLLQFIWAPKRAKNKPSFALTGMAKQKRQQNTFGICIQKMDRGVYGCVSKFCKSLRTTWTLGRYGVCSEGLSHAFWRCSRPIPLRWDACRYCPVKLCWQEISYGWLHVIRLGQRTTKTLDKPRIAAGAEFQGRNFYLYENCVGKKFGSWRKPYLSSLDQALITFLHQCHYKKWER